MCHSHKIINGTKINTNMILHYGILLYFDSIKYKMFSALKAYDMCFKIFHVFNVGYPLESNDVRLFIQTFFYNIKIKYDKSNVLIKQISGE